VPPSSRAPIPDNCLTYGQITGGYFITWTVWRQGERIRRVEQAR